MNTAEIALNFASVLNFIALVFLLRSVLKNRNTLRGFSVSGSFLTFISILGFEVAYFLMGNFFSVILGLATVVFWFIAFVYSLKQKLRNTENLEPNATGATS